MTEVNVSKEIKVSANQAWSKLSSFRGIEEFSPIERSETTGNGEGATRTCYLPDGAAINEVLSRVDNEGMEMAYKITQGPFPIIGYLSTIKVTKTGDNSCEINWRCQFESTTDNPNEMENLFTGFYNQIIDGLEGMILNES